MILFYDRDGQPLTDFAEIERLLTNDEYRRVAYTTLAESGRPAEVCEVSTVWVGINRRLVGDGPPLIFETMTFGPGAEGDCSWYATEAQARAGHADTITRLAATMDDPIVLDAR